MQDKLTSRGIPFESLKHSEVMLTPVFIGTALPILSIGVQRHVKAVLKMGDMEKWEDKKSAVCNCEQIYITLWRCVKIKTYDVNRQRVTTQRRNYRHTTIFWLTSGSQRL